jgi:sporulation protein YlmC with PRC-barrel domain
MQQSLDQDAAAANGSAQQTPPAGTPGKSVPSHSQPQDNPASGGPGPSAPVPLSALNRLPIVDLASGERVGTVSDVILSPTHRYVEAYVSMGGAFHRDGVFPARGATVGEHAVTLPRGALDNWELRGADHMPRASRLIGLKMLTETGRIVGEIRELRIESNSGTVLDYEVQPVGQGLLDCLRPHTARYFPASPVTQHGRDAVIVQDALARQYLGGDP